MDIHAALGRVGLPAPTAELAARPWDVIVVGGGHNGLACAAYLARAGRSVLVLEARDRLGGACTLERPFSDPRFVMSPCAYLVGLLHPLVIDELDLPSHGYTTWVADPSSWTPFADGTSLAQWKDEARTLDEVAALAPGDVEGWQRYWDVFARIRRALREGPRDTWVGDAPGDDELASLLAGDGEASEVVLGGLPIADLVERHVADPRLRTALHGGGIIGTNAGPRDPGTGWIRAMHELGTLGGWGYVEGGMGRISFAIAEAARAADAVLAAGVPVGAIHPGEGVTLEDGTRIPAGVVISNADPASTLALLDDAPESFAAKVAAWRAVSPVAKLNCSLSRLPTFTAAPDRPEHVYRAQVVVSAGIDATQAAFERARVGEPAPDWCELYFHTAYDPSVAPDGAHTMSAFCQYVPYTLATGDWETRRAEVADRILGTIAQAAPDIGDCVLEWELLAPPDVEARVGLTGGHIFQGECTPDQMWTRRFAARTPVDGLYLCGAATHPAGSVIGVNGRNAAMAVLADA